MLKLPPSLFIGPGRLAQALAPALLAAGWPVAGLGAREPSRAQRLAAQLGGCPVAPPQEAVAGAASGTWIWLCVPDGQLAAVAAELPWRAGQVVLHASGATGLDVLAPARAAGAEVAGFHPLQLFAGGPARLVGCGVGIEASSPALIAQLQALAEALGMQALVLRPETRLLYHAGANLAASGVLAVLAVAQRAWAQAGLPADEALRLLAPLTQGAIEAAAEKGLPGAVSGPVARGDVGVLRAQLAALGAGAPLYTLLAREQLALARTAGRLTEAQAAAVEAVLHMGLKRD